MPGGHLELHESFEECAAREVLEEAGIELPAPTLRVLGAVNSVQMRDSHETDTPARHYVTIFCSGIASETTQEAQLLEPDKCLGWEWVPLDWLVARATAQGESSKLRTQLKHQGKDLPVSEDKLALATRLGEQMGGRRQELELDPTGDTALPASSASFRVAQAADSAVQEQLLASELGQGSGPATSDEAEDWRRADEFADAAPLFQPLVNCFVQLPQIAKHGLAL